MLTACEPTAMSTAEVMDHPGDTSLLQSCGTADSLASLEDATAESTANESSEEESACARTEQSNTKAQQSMHTESGATPRPDSLSLPAKGTELWTTHRDGEVKLRMGESGPEAEPSLTVNQMFTSTVQRFGNYNALGWKDGEQWKTMTYNEYYKSCRTAAKSFLKLGLERYHGVGILGFNSVEWFIADIGAILAGGFAVGIYTTNSPEACQYVAENCQANILVVENHKQLQKILQVMRGSLANTLREIRPTAFMGVPRVWEKMQEKMKSIGAKSSTVRQKVASWAKDVGLQTNLNKMDLNGSLSRKPLNYRLAKRLVFRKVRKALGLDRCTRCYTGAAPITKDTLEFFLSLDIPLFELYGMSESSGPHTISLPDAFRLTSCGKVISGCKTKIFNPDADGNGEICFWGRHVFMGYLNMPDKTEEALDADGWLHSGDLGKHDQDDFLFITGRIKELIITAGGENIPPVPIEDAVKEAVPLISNAMLIGDKRKFLSMLLTVKCQVNNETGTPEDELTPEAVELCRKLGSNSTRVSEIASGRDRVVYAAIQEGINRVNEKATSNAQRIQKWTVLEKDFSIPGGELGPTMKLKRPVVMKMYKEQIENFYKEVLTPTTPDNPLPPK
ncbi:long-chain-fatty-acid--CoA ligase ACSBG2-like [Sinocyclocheilus grahami]|uniref:long-chain-fatty-acid--CoA ligase ACSBG2-like n=1 Tax=Sinocyclocheilus grahami TaxID=75366 RepID=UPI0007ACC6A1|nr:PREDICTED: long-chain-fatty-acid--CoA ligase ACSBG2-like [Sinocyclocheilus grahami]